MKHFNTAGVCLPDRHYMVDVTERVEGIRQMIEQKNFTWDASGVVDAVHELLNERNTLFEDLIWEFEHNPKQKTVRPMDNKIFETRIQDHLTLQQDIQDKLLKC